MHNAWWAHMHRFLSVHLCVTGPKIRLEKNSWLWNYGRCTNQDVPEGLFLAPCIAIVSFIAEPQDNLVCRFKSYAQLLPAFHFTTHQASPSVE